MKRRIFALFCILVIVVPVGAQEFFVKEWERNYTTEDQVEAIHCMDVGDMIGDSAPEIVVGMSVRHKADTQKHAVAILDNKGEEKYKWLSSYPINDVFICDLETDGVPEIIVAGADLYILSNKAMNLDFPPVGTVVFSAVAADLDMDGLEEILVGTREFMCISDTLSWTVPIGSQVKEIIVTDLSWDGSLEIVVLTMQNVHIFDTQGTKLWVSPGTQNLRSLTVADIDNDRNKEIIVSTDNRLIYMWEPQENGMEGEINLKSYGADFLAVEDVNKDGELEIVVASDSLRLGIYDLRGNVLWEYRFQQVEFLDSFTDMVLTDLDGDQWVDILLTHAITAMSGDLDSNLYFMKNNSGYIPQSEENSQYYDDALVLYNEGKCTEAIDMFSSAKAVFLDNGDQEMANTCQNYIDQCETILAIEKANSTYGAAEQQAAQGAYGEALQLYEEAKTLYEELGDSEKVQECSERIQEMQDLLSPPETTLEPKKEDRSLMIPFLLVVIVLLVVGGFVLVNHFKKPSVKPVAKEIKKEKKRKTERKKKVEKKAEVEKKEEVKKEKVVLSEKISEKERKLKAKFVYGEINRDEYRERLKKLYEEEG